MTEQLSKVWDVHNKSEKEIYRQSKIKQDYLLKHSRRYMFTLDNKTVLEYGFGDGYTLDRLASYHCNVTGLDISKDNIKRVKEVMPYVKFKLIKPDGRIPFSDDSVDIIIANGVIEHMEWGQLMRFIDECKRVLKFNGFLAATVPENENLSQSKCVCPKCLNEFHRWGHKESFSKGYIDFIFSYIGQKVLIKTFHIRYTSDNLIKRLAGFFNWTMRSLFGRWLELKGSYLFIYEKVK